MKNRASLSTFCRAFLIAALAGLVLVDGASARGTCGRTPDDEDASVTEPDHLADFYRRVALPPYFERRVQAILQAEFEEAQASAEKVGLRRMSRPRYRRTLAALARTTDTKIRALLGKKRFATWKRAREESMRALSRHDRCAGLGRLLRGASLVNTTVEEVHFWIHQPTRPC
jgi:hypothetical protein